MSVVQEYRVALGGVTRILMSPEDYRALVEGRAARAAGWVDGWHARGREDEHAFARLLENRNQLAAEVAELNAELNAAAGVVIEALGALAAERGEHAALKRAAHAMEEMLSKGWSESVAVISAVEYARLCDEAHEAERLREESRRERNALARMTGRLKAARAAAAGWRASFEREHSGHVAWKAAAAALAEDRDAALEDRDRWKEAAEDHASEAARLRDGAAR